jgi:predicted esterase
MSLRLGELSCLAGTLLVAVLGACRGAPDGTATFRGQGAETGNPRPLDYARHPPVTEGGASASVGLPALQAEWLVALGTEADGVVAPALGATAPRQVVVGVHGAGDRPEWSCGGWRLASQASSFVVCPRGSALTTDKFAWSSPQQLAQRVERAVSRTRELFGAHVDSGPMIYAGFSQGATLAEPLLRQHAARFPIAILAEGGYQTASSPAFARAFREAGGRRVVLVCGSASCFQRSRLSKGVLERAGVEVLVVGDPGAGHNLNGRMQQALQRAWPEISAPVHALKPR